MATTPVDQPVGGRLPLVYMSWKVVTNTNMMKITNWCWFQNLKLWALTFHCALSFDNEFWAGSEIDINLPYPLCIQTLPSKWCLTFALSCCANFCHTFNNIHFHQQRLDYRLIHSDLNPQNKSVVQKVEPFSGEKPAGLQHDQTSKARWVLGSNLIHLHLLLLLLLLVLLLVSSAILSV